MTIRLRRLKSIELNLTPRQVMVLWLRSAVLAGTFEEGARQIPPPREAIANAVRNAVRSSMKGEEPLLVERAVLQACQESDLLYNLAVHANVEVSENRSHREREYVYLLGYLSAETNGRATKNRIRILRLAVLAFLKSVVILDAAITKVEADHLNGQPVLFRDRSVQLQEQLQLGRVSEIFNSLASSLGSTGISLDELRTSLQSEIDREISIWLSLARIATVGAFGSDEEMRAAMDRHFLLCEPESSKGKNGVRRDIRLAAGRESPLAAGGTAVTTHKKRVDLVELEIQFLGWLRSERFLERLSVDQLLGFACLGLLPEPLPAPLPKGASKLDGLSRKRLVELWEDDLRFFGGRSEQELIFFTVHGHWPEQPCGEHCRRPRHIVPSCA